jgi:hypothetical protein
MHLKVFVKLKKTLKPSRLGKKTKKNQKNPKNPKKTPKNPKKPTGLGFFKKTRVFFQPWLDMLSFHAVPAHTSSKRRSGSVQSLSRNIVTNLKKCFVSQLYV